MNLRKEKPVTPTAFSILLALSLRKRHGYELIEQVNQDSNGRVKIGPGALYGTIKDLLQMKYIKEVKDQAQPQTARKRRYYQITEKGVGALEKEVSYFNHAADLARERSKKYIQKRA